MLPYILGAAAAAITAGIRAATDEEFEGAEFPASFRARLIEEHVQTMGYICPGYNRDAHRVARADLTVDHIIPVIKNGRTSKYNAQILCLSCNSSKGANYGFWEAVRGRRR